MKVFRGRLVLLCFFVVSALSTSILAIQPQSPAARSDQSENEVVGYELSFPALGTVVTFKAFHEDRRLVDSAFELAQQRVQMLAGVLTDYDPKSEVRKLTQTATLSPTKVSDDLWNVLVASDEWHRRTGGAFDSSLGQLTSLWRKFRRVNKVPAANEIRQALVASGWLHVTLDNKEHSVKFATEGLRLDFGAIGKGYIVDEAFEVLRANGLPCTLVNISGNMRCGTPPPDRAGWRIEVSPLESGGEPLRQFNLANAAVATSGDLWQYIMVDGQRRSHILNPETGVGVLGPISATVIAKTATDADALATAACILDWAEIEKLVDKLAKDSPTRRVQILVARREAGGKVTMKATDGFPEGLE